MTPNDSARTWWLPSRLPVDDAYTDWFGAHNHRRRPRRERARRRPRTYIAELQIEEAAARRLEQLHPRPAAP